MPCITITMNSASVTALNQGSYALCSFLGAMRSGTAGTVLCWGRMTTFLEAVQISWNTTNLMAYISTSAIADGSSIFAPQPSASFTPLVIPIANGGGVAGSSRQLGLGQELSVADSGAVSVQSGSEPNVISITNASTSAFTAGIGMRGNSPDFAVSVALPLHGQQSVNLAPNTRLLLAMLPNPAPSCGEVVEQLDQASVLVDTNTTPTPTLHYDINNGWSGDGSQQAAQVPLDSLLLTTPSPSAAAH